MPSARPNIIPHEAITRIRSLLFAALGKRRLSGRVKRHEAGGAVKAGGEIGYQSLYQKPPNESSLRLAGHAVPAHLPPTAARRKTDSF
jgi:hypothetical protein